MMRWAWFWRDRGEVKSLSERMRGPLSLSCGWLQIDSHSWILFQTLVCACACVRVRVRERERQWRGREREWESRREGERAPWKQLQQHKMEFVSTLPELCTFSIHLSDTADFPPLTFLTFRVVVYWLQVLWIYNTISMLLFAFVENIAPHIYWCWLLVT